jgi:hypothetical protein
MDDHFRLSDADRDRAAALLRDHFEAGRLTAEELNERLTVTLRATTFGDLRCVLADLPEPAPVPQQPSGLRSRAALERCYRRLLVFYPAQYRRVHEAEMLAVLMTAAPSGKRWPGIAEAADLILGALRVRLQPSRADPAEPAWRDALAVLSVILPVIVLLIYTVQEAQALRTFPAPGAFSDGFPLWALQGLTVPLAMVALALLRLQRAATLAAVGLLIWLVYVTGWPGWSLLYGTADAYILLALGLQIVAVAASPGPRRGLQILTWKHGALVVIATLIATLAFSITTYAVTLIVIAVICAALALASSLGRWLLLLLAIPAWPFFVPPLFITPWEIYLPSGLGFIGQAYLPPAALLVVFGIAARRESVRLSQFPPASR